ncbi:HEAT repeat domain-containing protein [Stomatobaculum sp. F0698]|uniref:HEAT repeat domain-containing protein n=1 Tax=Stomatobaculum sp. F0698 TaxID=3059030 RepID=UPI00272D68E2|nr:HEAT repeat domain-containing protein [Stomatobaculum sp. F0698]WLD86240.1 HEAT repeat domain-containing protein [Stomatobaculum sp. F0698]
MRKSYRELTEEIKTDGERLKLIAALGSSDDLAYHYALICEDWAAGGKLLLENSFDRHGEAGIIFLLEQLRAFGTASKTGTSSEENAAVGSGAGREISTDTLGAKKLQRDAGKIRQRNGEQDCRRNSEQDGQQDCQQDHEQDCRQGGEADTAYLAAKILSQLRHRDFYAARAKELAALLTARWEISDIALRRKQIIALGWIGSESEINLLIDSMQSDSDALCRAWAAAALMQLSFHAVDAAFLRERTKTAFAAAIQKEGDLNAAGIMIEAVQTLFGKKWISAAAAEAAESESIEKARKSALRFLGKA